jgi:hypothetical protein
MKISFAKASKYFFWAAGIVTALGPLPAMLNPRSGLQLTIGLTYIDESPQLAPIVGHWGIMVVGMGVLLFLSATIKSLRKTTIIFSTAEKAYMVGFALFNFSIGATYAMHYLIPLVGDSLMVLGGIWYLWQSRKLKRD